MVVERVEIEREYQNDLAGEALDHAEKSTMDSEVLEPLKEIRRYQAQ